ncbi:ATP-binding protein [Nostoc ellipsosporum NOK]|nr:ATP-binding protein [Nostoc ellipsosporum NOK]
MDKINWSSYSDKDFTLFCNALLTFEFGKSFQGFSASGKDGGIDGAFNGTYDGLNGLWRFQYKFRQGPRIEGFRNLKSVVKSELENLQDEKAFVLLTNIELLPQELQELQITFEEELNLLNKDCKVFIWEGAKLFNLYLSYPLLELWQSDGFNTAQLQDYRSVFKKNFETSDFTPGTLNNIFISRKDDLEKLEAFLLGDERMALVTGEAGIGKTRLIIEFFKRKVDQMDNWIALVLLNRNIEFDKIRKALSGDKNYVILIDDAHTYQPEIISDMKALSEGLANKIKLILTTRNLEAFQSLSLIREYEKTSIPHIGLGNLSRQDTQDLFLQYIAGKTYANFIDQLIEISYGKPILIVAILNAIQNNIAISKIREQGFLKSYVHNYFNSYYKKVTELTGWSELKIKRVLQHVVLIEPFNYNDSAVIQKLCALNNVETTELSTALKLLIDHGFVDGRYTQSIKPDYYSDILLSEINRTEVANNISDFMPFLDNIIVNLSSVDEISEDRTKVLEEILTAYCAFILTSEDIDFIYRILGIVVNIAGFKPAIARQAIDLYLEGLANKRHVIWQQFETDKQYLNHGNSLLSKVIELLSFLLNFPGDYDFVFRKTTKLFELTDDPKVASVYGFAKRDAVDKFSCKRQHFFMQEFERKIDKLTVQQQAYGIFVIGSLLNLEFTHTALSPTNRMAVNISTYYIPAAAPVRKLRENIATVLIKLYAMTKDAKSKLDILKLLLDIPRSIFSTHRNSNPYANNKEIKIVLNFLEDQAPDFGIIEKKEAQEKLYWFTRWGIPTEFLQQINTITNRMQPKNLTEQLSHLFSKAELSILERPRPEGYIVEKCDAMVALHNKKEMAKSIIEFLDPQPYQPAYFYTFINNLIEKHPDYAKELYEQLFNSSPKLFEQYASSILGGAYYRFKDIDFYWTQVETLQNLDKPELDNILLQVYGNRVPGQTVITKKDIDVILTIFNKKRSENNYNLANGLQSVIVGGHPQALQVCRDFLSRATQKQAEMFFIWLSDNKTATTELIDDLVLNHTLRFAITYEIERGLNMVLTHAGTAPLFQYFKKRFGIKKQNVISEKTLMGYEFVPHGNHSRLFDNCPESYKYEMFRMAVEWYMELDGAGGHLFYARDILDYLKPGESVNGDFFDWYSQLIGQRSTDGIGVDRIVDTLTVFHTKDDFLLDLVIAAFTIGNDIQETNPELFRGINQNCYLAITTVGVKSGTSGEPFQVDLDLQNLLNVKIANLPEYLPATQFLKKVLDSVNKDIERSIDTDNLQW